MIVEDVENIVPTSGGPGSPPGLWARVMKITTSRGAFQTPARILTRAEHMARSTAAVSRALPPDLAVDFRPLDQRGAYGLAGGGSAAEGIIRSTRQFNSCTRRALLRISVAQPPDVALRAMSAGEKIRLADAHASMFRESLDAEIVAYPYLGLGASEYLRFITRRSRRDEACTALFTLDMGMDPFSLDKVLAHIRRDRRPAIVPLIHRDPDRTTAQHRILAGHMRDEKTAFLACQVPRIGYVRGRAVSNLHTASLRHGYDMVSLEQRRPGGGGGDGNGSARPLDLNRIMFYSRSGLRIDTMRDALAQRGAGLVDEFDLNENNGRDRVHIAGMLEAFDEAAADRRRFRMLEALAKVHEALNSPLEFARMRDMASAGLLGEYLSQTAIGRAGMPAPKDPAQTLMTDYVVAA